MNQTNPINVHPQLAWGFRVYFSTPTELLYYTPHSFSVKWFTRFSSPRESVALEGLRGYDREND